MPPDTRASVNESRAGRHGLLHPVLHPCRGPLVDEGGHPRLCVTRVTHDDLAHPVGQSGQEVVADGLDDDDPLHADAGLPRGVIAAADHRVGGRVEVGIIGHDERRVGAELEQHLGRRRIAGDLVPDDRRAGEGHHPDPPVRGQRDADLGTARDELHHRGTATRSSEQPRGRGARATAWPTGSAAPAWR